MINKRYEIENEKDYKKYNNFEISDNFKEILREDYFLYNSKDFLKKNLIEDLYKINFNDKYDESSNAMVYEKYINNENFKNKALFIYSMIDENKYKTFVQNNPDVKNPNDYSLHYSIIDSDGTKVDMYNINLVDITFVY